MEERTMGDSEEFRLAMEAIRDYLDAAKELEADVQHAAGTLDSPHDHRPRRTYIRAVFALIEAHVWGLKQVALAWFDGRRSINEAFKIFVHLGPTIFAPSDPLPPEERLLLSEAFFRLNKKGEPERDKQRHLNFKQNLKFACRMFAKAWGKDFSLEAGGPGWDALFKAVKIRNRITHPKSRSNLEINEEEMRIVQKAYQWFKKSIVDKHTKALEDALAPLQQRLAAQAPPPEQPPDPPKNSTGSDKPGA